MFNAFCEMMAFLGLLLFAMMFVSFVFRSSTDPDETP